MLSFSNLKSTPESVWSLSKPKKTRFGVNFSDFYSPPDLSELFFKKLGSITFLSLWISIFMQKIRANWSAISKILRSETTDEQTNRPTKRTDRGIFVRNFHRKVSRFWIQIWSEIFFLQWSIIVWRFDSKRVSNYSKNYAW